VNNLHRRVLVCVVALALLAGGAGAARAASVEVKVENIVFVPAEVTIFEGDTVVWTWANGTHSTTSEDCMCGCTCLWDSGVHATGTPAFQFEYTFDTAGDYAYYCQVHVARGMVATVHVLPAPGKVAAQKAADRPAGLALLAVGLCGCGLCGYARHRRQPVV
jgi:plastocyanin